MRKSHRVGAVLVCLVACGLTTAELAALPSEGTAADPLVVGSGEAIERVTVPSTIPVEGEPGVPPLNPEACSGGVVRDDGTLETGYGFVPSVIDGRYVQEITSSEVGFRSLSEVCVCWTRTSADDSIDFEWVLYEERGDDRPRLEALATIPASATGVPEFDVDGGRFYAYDLGSLPTPFGRYFLGVRWDASADQFFFVCADHSEGLPPAEVFFFEEQAEDWTSVFETQDPIFLNHTAMMVRAVADSTAPVDVPALDPRGIAVLATILAMAGLLGLRKLAFRRAGRSERPARSLWR